MITLKKGVCDFPYVVWFLFYKLLKFDVINADVPFCKRGHNLETEAKLNKARHPFQVERSTLELEVEQACGPASGPCECSLPANK